MKKMIYLLLLLLVVVSGLVFSFVPFAYGSDANREITDETKPSVAPGKPHLDERKKWEASPDGIAYKAWEVSPEGKKVHASYEKIERYLTEFADMEAAVTSVTFRRANTKSPGPKWLIVRIHGEEYMMQFSPQDFGQLNGLKVKYKIMIRSRSAGCSPNHPFLILSGDYISQNNKVLFKRDFNKNNGC